MSDPFPASLSISFSKVSPISSEGLAIIFHHNHNRKDSGHK
jgi:hypothetical protein